MDYVTVVLLLQSILECTRKESTNFENSAFNFHFDQEQAAFFSSIS